MADTVEALATEAAATPSGAVTAVEPTAPRRALTTTAIPSACKTTNCSASLTSPSAPASHTAIGFAWLSKIRPWWGHNYHFHVRLRCPANDRACENQDPLPPGDGCDESLAWWFSDAERARLDKPIVPPAKLPKPMALAELPPACRGVLNGS